MGEEAVARNMQMQQEENLVEQNLPPMPEEQIVDSDDKLLHNSDATNLREHNNQYTKLLEAYVENSIHILEDKRLKKEGLFNIAKGILKYMPIGTFLVIGTALWLIGIGKVEGIEVLPEIITALGALVGAYIVIPNMITGYLFNEKEEEHLAEIIGKIQDYDKEIRGRM